MNLRVARKREQELAEAVGIASLVEAHVVHRPPF